MMKNLLLFVLTIFFYNAGHAQNDPASQQFIRSVFKQQGIVYTDSLDEFSINFIKDALSQDTIRNDGLFNRHNDHPAKMVFNKAERQYINQQVDSLKYHSWHGNLINGSAVISTDTVRSIFKRPNGWAYFHKHYGKELYSFSKPIFIRNNTMCIFYIGSTCDGLCGEGDVYVYIKKDGIWKAEFLINTWLS